MGTRRRTAALSAALALAITALAPAAVADAAPVSTTRVSGPGRVETAIAVAQRSHPDGADSVVLARADDAADALAGGPLAAHLDAPLLLTGSRSLPAAVAAEIGRLGAAEAILLGGQRALGPEIADALRRRGVVVRRIAGVDRFDTAGRTAAEWSPSTVLLADGIRGWPDAVSGGALAGLTGAGVLLTAGRSLPASTRTALRDLRPAEIVAVGGTGVVSDAVLAEAAALTGARTRRLGGVDRYATSVAVLEDGPGAAADRRWLVTGRDWADALTAGPAAAREGAGLLLVDGRVVLGGRAAMAELARSRPGALVVAGGRAAVGDHVLDAARRTTATGRPPVGGAFNAAAAAAYARHLTQTVGPRPAGSAADRAARAWLADRLRRAGWQVTEDAFALPQGGTSANVVAWLPGADPRGGRHVVVGGHLDTVAGSPGGNDNASGIGLLVALAEELADEPTETPTVLVGFGAEEYQAHTRIHHVGSEAYAARHAGRVAAMVSADMLANGPTTCICWLRGADRSLADRLGAVAAGNRLGGFLVASRGDISDHGPFAARGVPAAFLWTFISPGYHGPGDTADRIITADLARSGRLLLAWLRAG